MRIFTYILCFALVIFTVFNFIALISAKKRKAVGNRSYQAIIWPIEQRLLKYMKERGLDYSIVKRMINDKGEGIIFVSDPKNKVAAVAMSDDTLHFHFSELENVERYYQLEGKKTTGAMVVLTVDGTDYKYMIASSKFNPRGLLGKVLYDTTEDFYSVVHAILEDKEKGNDQEKK